MKYKVKWANGRKTGESEPLISFDAARAVANTKVNSNKVVTILKEGDGVNAGQFYLHLIVK